MIKGVGTDIIEIYRIKKAIDRNNKFIDKVFTENERKYFETRKYNYNTIAGNFAAKESVSKALGTGFRSFNLSDVEILRDNLGKPMVILHNNALVLKRDMGIDSFYLSISHCVEYAIAYVVAEGE